MTSRTRATLLVTAGLLGVALVAPATVSATQPDPEHRVTICHRTNSVSNPYVVLTVDEASVDGDNGNDNGQGDHLLEHTGPAFDFSADPDVAYPAPHNGDQWGDIIPPFYEDGVTPTGYPTLNWDASGMAIFVAGCAAPVPDEEETPPAEETPPTEEESPSDEVDEETEVTVTPPATDSVPAEAPSTTDPAALLLLLAAITLAGALSADRARSGASR